MSVYSEEMVSDFYEDEDNSDDEGDKKVPSFVRQGARVYIKHDFYFGNKNFLNAHWQGQWHLAYVEEGLNEEGAIKVLWARNGRLHYHDIEANDFQFKEFSPSNKTIISIEDDGRTNNIYTAKFASFPENKPGRIKIRWDNGSTEEVDLSRVCMDVSKRRRQKTNHLGFNEDFTMKTSDADARSTPKRRAKPRKLTKKVNVAVQSSSSSDESDDSEPRKDASEHIMRGSRKKAKPTTAKVTQSSSSSSSSDEQSGTREKRTAAVRKPHNVKNQEVVLQGFTQSTPESLTTAGLVEYMNSLLASLSLHDPNSEGYTEVLTDMQMVLQERLYNVKDKTTLTINRMVANSSAKSTGSNECDNRSIITKAAKSFGLTNEQVDELFGELEVDDLGYYSVNDAVPRILAKRTNSNHNSQDNLKSSHLVGSGVHLGARVKTVFEDGSEHEGTIATVHYRVLYDDGDTETFNQREAYENLACNNTFHSSKYLSKISMLELFSGCSLLSTLCRRKGMEVMSVDNDLNSNATIKADFTSEYVQSLIVGTIYDYIHASPVCSTHSHMAGGKHRSRENYNKSPESHNADGILMLLYINIKHQVQQNPNCIVTIENPVGWMKEGNIMKELFLNELGFRMYRIFYCQFERDEMKPTCIWTNDYKLGEILTAIGGKCKCWGKHKESVQGTKEKNFAALPMELCKIISDYVYSKVVQLKFHSIVTSKADEHVGADEHEVIELKDSEDE